MKVVGLLVFLVACDTVFDLHRPPPDAAPEHDEDGDGIDDLVDNCPHVKSSDQTDGDGDNIGDLCDPRPTTSGDVARFFAFYDGPGALKIQGTSGSDPANPEDLVFGDDLALTTAYVTQADDLPLRVDEASVEVGFTVDGPGVDGMRRQLAVVFVNQADTTNGRGDDCFVGYTTGPAPTYLELVENASRPHAAKETATSLQGVPVKVVASRSPAELTCALTESGFALSDAIIPPLIAPGVGRLGLWADKVRTRLHYLWIVTRS